MKRAPSPTLPLNPSLREYDFVTLREDISREVAWLPISSLRRFGRLAVSLARGLRLARREREPIGRDEVTALVLGTARRPSRRPGNSAAALAVDAVRGGERHPLV